MATGLHQVAYVIGRHMIASDEATLARLKSRLAENYRERERLKAEVLATHARLYGAGYLCAGIEQGERL